MPVGIVKWFNPKKGYGFISPEDGDKDAFVHITAVQGAGLDTLNEGDKVEYVVEFSGANLASASISELGIFNTATSGASGEAMLSRVNFNALTPLASTDKLEFKFTMVVA